MPSRGMSRLSEYLSAIHKEETEEPGETTIKAGVQVYLATRVNCLPILLQDTIIFDEDFAYRA